MPVHVHYTSAEYNGTPSKGRWSGCTVVCDVSLLLDRVPLEQRARSPVLPDDLFCTYQHPGARHPLDMLERGASAA